MAWFLFPILVLILFKVLRSSNKMGRVNHSRVESGQMGADTERVKEIMKKCEQVYLEMEPGKNFASPFCFSIPIILMIIH